MPTLLTAVYNPGQAIVAAAAGATYIAPYLGKLQDAGLDGFDEIIAMQQVLAATGSSTKVLLASVRNVAAMVRLARHGVDCLTMAPAVAEEFFADELTARGGAHLRGRGRGNIGMIAPVEVVARTLAP